MRCDFVVILPPFPSDEGATVVIFRPVTDRGREFSRSFHQIARRGISLGIVCLDRQENPESLTTLDAISASGLTIEVL